MWQPCCVSHISDKSQTQLDQVLFLFDYMFRPILIRPSSGRNFFVEETVQFCTISCVKIKSKFWQPDLVLVYGILLYYKTILVLNINIV